MRIVLRACLAGVVVSVALLAPGGAGAATPGKIVFHSDRVGQNNDDIWTMNGDGSGLLQITTTASPVENRDPTWSPDGRQIAFMSSRDGTQEIWVMNADGSSPRPVTHFATASGGAITPQWAPDGRTLVFSGIPNGDTTDDIFQINADGSGLRPITNTPAGGQDFYYVPAVSPDGQWIVFTHQGPNLQDDYLTRIRPDGTGLQSLTSFDSYDPSFSADGKRIFFDGDGDPFGTNPGNDPELFSMSADGGDLRQLTANAGPGSSDLSPGASRDGLNTIAWSSNRDPEHNAEIFAMNADGSGINQLTHDVAGDQDRNPDWQPNVICRGLVATIIGTSASETLTGGPGADIISGQGGKDTINGLDGNDVICGDAGKDKLIGGKGKDQLDGGKGNDKLNGGKGKDKCVGGKGKHDTGKSCEKEKKIP